MNSTTVTTFLGLMLSAACASAAVPAPAVSTAAARSDFQGSTATVSSIYTGERLRDPFARAGGGGRGQAKPFSMEDFSIHKLSMRGILQDGVSDFALFTDSESGVRFLLRKGRLYDAKGKALPGVGGKIDMKRKMATLTAPEGDVQVFRLGEEEKE